MPQSVGDDGHDIFGNPTPDSIVMVDNNSTLWTYNGNLWESLTGSNYIPQPQEVGGTTGSPFVIGNPTVNSIVMADNNNTIWKYNGVTWESLTGDNRLLQNPEYLYYNNQRTDQYNNNNIVYRIYGTPTTDSIVLVNESNNIFAYNGSNWTPLNFKNTQPTNTRIGIFGNPTPTSMIISYGNELWKYDSNTWSQIPTINQYSIYEYYNPQQHAGMAAPSQLKNPSQQNKAFGTSTTDFMVITDNNNQLWVYNGSTWTQLSGSKGAPTDIQYVQGNPTINSMVAVDNSNRLWIYESSQ